jgi:hypothetical protein
MSLEANIVAEEIMSIDDTHSMTTAGCYLMGVMISNNDKSKLIS